MFFPVVKRFLLLVGVFVLVSAPALSKDPEWREITPRELAMDKPVVDPDADVEALFWEIRINDSKRTKLSRDNYVRVKIFNDRGREDFSKFDIPYTKGYKIKDIAARVIRPDGSIVAINKNDIFDREIVKTDDRKIKAKSFAIPNIEAGVIVEYQYREVIKGAGAVGMTLDFQKDIPVHELSYYYKPWKKLKPQYQLYNFENVEFVKDEKGYFLAQRKNIPAYKSEPFMPPSGMVKPWMQLQSVGVSITDLSVGFNRATFNVVVKDPNNPMSYWGAVVTEKKRRLEYYTKKDKKIKKEAERITAGLSSTTDKIKALYEYCQNEIHNISFDNEMTEEELDNLPRIKKLSDLLKTKNANARFVNYLFGALADAAGLSIAHVYSGDRDEMFFNISMTNERLVHFAAIGIRVNGEWEFFDPGTPFLKPGELLWNEQKVTAILVDKGEGSFQETPYQSIKDTNVKRTADLVLEEDGSLKGDIKYEYSGVYSTNYRMENYDVDSSKREEAIKDNIQRRISTAEVTNISIENFDEKTKPIVQKAKIKIPNYAQKTGKRLFVQPGFFGYGRTPLFTAAERKYDVAFSYPWSETDEIRIKLPEGYKLDNATAPAPLFDNAKIGSLTVNISHDTVDNTLIYKRDFYFGNKGKIVFPVSVYPAIKQMFDGFHKINVHKISIKREEPTP